MRKRLFMILPAAAIALALVANVSAVTGAESGVPGDVSANDGTNCFLVPLQADAIESTSDYVDVAALIDFSAAQLSSTFVKRRKNTVAALVANLPENAACSCSPSRTKPNRSLTDTFPYFAKTQRRCCGAQDQDALGAADLEKSYHRRRQFV